MMSSRRYQCKIATSSRRLLSTQKALLIHPRRCLLWNHGQKYNGKEITNTANRFINTKNIRNQEWLVDILRDRVVSGELFHDASQDKAAKRLTQLQKALVGYSNQEIISRMEENLRKQNNVNINNEKSDANDIGLNADQIRIPRGLFIHGKVGVGKSFLMDLFCQYAPMKKKRQVHFHSFMQEVHQRIHDLKQQDLATKGRNFSIDTSVEENPIQRVGVQIADEVALLCFDEFQVTDVADALMLSQLFSVLFNRGTVVVATSNRHPSTLYEGGLNRGYFLPFIDILCKHCIVHNMDANIDYRSFVTEGLDSFYFTYNCSHEKDSFMETSRRLCQSSPFQKKWVNIAFNRKLEVMTNDTNVAKFDFDELCNVELGSSDYRVIAQRFPFLIIENIPKLTLKEHDQARRFITLVDELYEGKCALLCSAATNPNDLFVDNGIPDDERDIMNNVEVDASEMLGIDAAQSNGVALGELASVRELAFAFRRAASRLKEMTSKLRWEEHNSINQLD